MAKKDSKQSSQRNGGATKSGKSIAAPDSTKPSSLQFIGGIVLLLVAIVATGVLVGAHIAHIATPGCAPGSGCDEAARSVWGKIPGLNYPVSAVGFAYFLAALIGWIASRNGVSSAFRWLVRLGVLVSLFYIGVMLVGKFSCKYCLASHLANVAFWLIVESTRKAAEPRALGSLAAACVAFAVSTIALFGLDRWQNKAVEDAEKIKFDESISRITANSATQPAQTAPDLGKGKLYTPEGGFTGRWLWGPENAPIRLVIYSDYQCPDCKEIERQVELMMSQRKDVSVSHKHYPMCTDCNVHMGRANMHPNACWAARAAEAAGIVGGNEAFWKMHRWLFKVKGAFETVAALEPAFAEVGFTPEQRKRFLEIIETEQTVAPVKADLEEAHMLGLHFTPMIFINGVELRGFLKNPHAIALAINQVAASKPQPGSPSQDQPPLAIDKCIADWLNQPVVALPTTPTTWPLGPADAKIEIQVWLDSQFPFSLKIDNAVREIMERRGDVRYIVRSFPNDNKCNPFSQVKRISPGCMLAHALLAAGQLGGGESFWKCYQWIVNTNREKYTEDELKQAAPSFGLDGAEFIAAINSPEIQALQQQEVNAIGPLVKQGIPRVYINGRWVARWEFDGEVLIDDIVEEAAKLVK